MLYSTSYSTSESSSESSSSEEESEESSSEEVSEEEEDKESNSDTEVEEASSTVEKTPKKENKRQTTSKVKRLKNYFFSSFRRDCVLVVKPLRHWLLNRGYKFDPRLVQFFGYDIHSYKLGVNFVGYSQTE